MSEITGQIDLIDGTEVTETVETTNQDIVVQLTDEVFGTETSITAYKIHKIVNAVFQVHGIDKKVPPQMMYTYNKNGLIVKGQKGLGSFNKDQVTEFVLRYTDRQMNK